MNKDLPEPIKEIFTNLDPLIWKGVWLEILEKLLSHDEMVLIWQNLYEAARSAYSDGTNSTKTDHEINMPFDQFLKWECKGFVAQAIKQKNALNDQRTFNVFMHTYFTKKNMGVGPPELFERVYKILNED